jgi:chemotaxis protein CheZ
MTNAADDFDALFDEVSAQSKTSAPAPAPAPAPAAAAEDDLESLFDEVSSARPAAVVAAPAPAPVAAEAAAPAAAEGEEKPMFERLGGIVRLLHDSLRELGYDKALTEASSQINDAQDRLEYVATLTEQAANKVLNTLDEGMPEQDALSKKSKDMEHRWADLFAGKLSQEQFKQLAGDSQAFAAEVKSGETLAPAQLLATL